MIRFPAIPARLGLGVGMNLPWGTPIGFVRSASRGDGISDKLRTFLARRGDEFRYLCFAFQPRSRNRLDAEEYFAAYDALLDAGGRGGDGRPKPRAFHHTLLNLGAVEAYDLRTVADFTNALVRRYGFAWIVEDLGIWSLRGKPLPYPLPPILTPEGLRRCIENLARAQASLDAPLCVEFPGFSEGTSFFAGGMHAFDFFAAVAEETRSPVTIDVGHVLAYQWLLGKRGDGLLEGLERLPLAHCFEVHLSGCEITRGKFRDLHHGVLLDEQLALLEHLVARCPNLRAITYEDPQYSASGDFPERAAANYERLAGLARRWAEAA